ncbi:MAG: ASPIC/UnbV domain-containing protein, partial [Chromatiales bacterium]|nr:ASPIC/UnbV domain-containing protein [Chromatiales bacterium]
MRPLRHDSGPDQIFRNVCNYGNHWVELDLRGRWPASGGSNPEGVGATVYVTAGGVTQMREQNGGHHRWSQHHQRLHFGLGPDAVIDEVVVKWPDGSVDTFLGDIAANQIYLAEEGAGALQPVTLGGGTQPPGTGPECREPDITPATEQGLFLWRDCPSDTWHMRVTAGGPDRLIYNGLVTAEQPFPAPPLPFSIENNDVLDNSDPLTILYDLKVVNTGKDGFSFEMPATGQTCFRADTTIYLGISKTPVGTSLDLASLTACGNLAELSIDDVTVSEESGMASFTVSLSTTSSEEVRVDYSTIDATATAPDDYTAVSGTLILAPGETSGQVQVPIIDDALSEGMETFTLQLSNPVGAIIANDTGTGTITDNEASACGQPDFDPATERGLFLWQDCPTATWHVRATAAGPDKVVYNGLITAEQDFPSAPVPFSIEQNDVLDASASRAISFMLSMRNSGQDGFSFDTPASGQVCFEVTAPPDVQLFVGVQKDAVGNTVNLGTLGPCSTIP